MLGLVLGLAAALAVNKLALSIPLVILGIVLGVVIGRLAGARCKRKVKRSNMKIRNLYKYLFDSYLSAISKYSKNLTFDVNSHRILLEESIDKFRLPLYLAKQEKINDFNELLFNLEKILSDNSSFKAMNLSWKLFLVESKKHIVENDISK